MNSCSNTAGKATKNKEPICDTALQGFKYFKVLWPLLKELHSVRDHPQRLLHYDQYISLILFYFFNPVIESLRAIREVSQLEKVRRVLGIHSTSLGSLSEAGNVFDYKLLTPILKGLAEKAIPLETDFRLKGLEKVLTAFDGTLLPALPKMLWALWLDEKHKAAKLHLEFNIVKGAPTKAYITDAKANEKTIFRKALSKGKLYVVDAGYADYHLLQDIKDAESSFVVRLRENAVWDTLYERELTLEDRKAGVKRDLVVRLGCDSKKHELSDPVRLVEIHHFDPINRPRPLRVSSKKTFRTKDSEYDLLLATDLLDLSADLIAMIYRYRWQIELFFRWFKCVLKCKHLLSLSENGVAIQVYCALIASLLISLWSGRKPTKRIFEMICLHMQGWASDEELEKYLKTFKKAENQKNNS